MHGACLGECPWPCSGEALGAWSTFGERMERGVRMAGAVASGCLVIRLSTSGYPGLPPRIRFEVLVFLRKSSNLKACILYSSHL